VASVADRQILITFGVMNLMGVGTAPGSSTARRIVLGMVVDNAVWS